MSPTIGFVILSYNEPGQLLRLIKRLNSLFADPPVVCHHNFTITPLETSHFPSNARFVRPHINTNWGQITVPIAALAAFRTLRDQSRPDWYILLSGSDYPVKKAEEVLDELRSEPYDLYLDYREIPEDPGTILDVPWSDHRVSREWVAVARWRYFGNNFSWDKSATGGVTRPSASIFAGNFFFQGNARSIDYLLENPLLPELLEYFRTRLIPDECLFHTVFCQSAALRISRDNKRYEDWTEGGAHPKVLTSSDVTKIGQSGAHFARKFSTDTEVLQLIDRDLLKL